MISSIRTDFLENKRPYAISWNDNGLIYSYVSFVKCKYDDQEHDCLVFRKADDSREVKIVPDVRPLENDHEGYYRFEAGKHSFDLYSEKSSSIDEETREFLSSLPDRPTVLAEDIAALDMYPHLTCDYAIETVDIDYSDESVSRQMKWQELSRSIENEFYVYPESVSLSYNEYGALERAFFTSAAREDSFIDLDFTNASVTVNYNGQGVNTFASVSLCREVGEKIAKIRDSVYLDNERTITVNSKEYAERSPECAYLIHSIEREFGLDHPFPITLKEVYGDVTEMEIHSRWDKRDITIDFNEGTIRDGDITESHSNIVPAIKNLLDATIYGTDALSKEKDRSDAMDLSL